MTVLALTLGDPAGIGPEIVARTLTEPDLGERALAVGDARALRRAVEVCGLDVEVHPIGRVDEALFQPGVLDVLDQDVLTADPPWGKVDADAGRAAIAAVEAATRAALRGEVNAVVTAPINKEAI